MIETMKLAFDIGAETWIKPSAGIRSLGTLGDLISNILPTAYLLSGAVLFFLLIIGGLTFIMKAGSGDEQGAKTGRQAILAAIVGFLIIFASYWIIQVIEIITGLNLLKVAF